MCKLKCVEVLHSGDNTTVVFNFGKRFDTLFVELLSYHEVILATTLLLLALDLTEEVVSQSQTPVTLILHVRFFSPPQLLVNQEETSLIKLLIHRQLIQGFKPPIIAHKVCR